MQKFSIGKKITTLIQYDLYKIFIKIRIFELDQYFLAQIKY